MSKKNDDVCSSADLLKSSHPCHATFVKWLEKKGAQPTKRQAAKFFQQYPKLRITLPKAA